MGFEVEDFTATAVLIGVDGVAADFFGAATGMGLAAASVFLVALLLALVGSGVTAGVFVAAG